MDMALGVALLVLLFGLGMFGHFVAEGRVP